MQKKPLSIATLCIISGLASIDAQAQEDSKKCTKQRPNLAEIFSNLDADQNGDLSMDEAKGPLAQHFDRVDSSQDGVLSQDEVEQAVGKLHKTNKRTVSNSSERRMQLLLVCRA